MLIGERLRTLRQNKQLSQGDIEKRTGLLRCYISRVENGHTVPAIETLEKMARAMEIPMYQLFYEGAKPLEPLNLPSPRNGRENEWGDSGTDAKMLRQFRRVLARTNESDQKLLLHMARKMAGANRSKA
jgi:transcriptional regulator with XRE-family HTH domain